MTFAVLDKDDQTLRELPPAEHAMAPRAGTGKIGAGTGKIGEVFTEPVPVSAYVGGSKKLQDLMENGGRAFTAFTPTAAERQMSVRADGSVRLRAVVRLFPS